ncbi:MAG: hypothetical protein QOI50_3922 [Pseudonocardiales bacterium]|jgi:DNA-binding transcriptional LysR family regulator|nr:hypothetical protein [Pseudonocardiales bacterium]MDT7631992.1 hypothetical protein [Pseudonocardiales bacterium]MDT7678874.1 hypothetical protein [Pseudonocardiales bacterium]MDT7753760.1 hypothetical protein [Pseudonocardiales bacterium]
MGLGGVDLNLLVALDALLTERNVTRAAERTSVGQPAMSASLARLRAHFGDPLLVRVGRGLMPTPLAESLVGPVRDALAAAEVVMGRSREFDPTNDRRSFTIMASDYVTLVLLRPLLVLLDRQAPRVQISVTPISPGYEDQLRRGQADLLILPREVVGEPARFPHVALFTDRYVLAVDRDNALIGDRASADELAKMTYVAYSGGPLRSVAEVQLEELGIHRRIEVSTQGFVVAPFLLRGTQLATVMHEKLAGLVSEAARLRIVEPVVPLRPIHEVAYWNPRHTEDPAHRWLRKRIVELAATV